ncbi:Protein HIRA [Picochlorum sp. SENEW3]|nr:Protein HIRA [Picochlorum sp. SENEW3]
MLVDKLPWCRHGGSLIFSIHTQQNGNRFATGGGDHCVKIWSLAVAVNVRKESDTSSATLLATLTDHNGPVNVVRFSPVASMVASGSDDGVACVYELHNGPGGGVMGGEANVENWRTKYVLKGHSSNIVDLSWSPDGAYLATASLDNSVIVWDMGTGKAVKTLVHHSSFVKGVAWDPVGTYLATQSEDASVVILKRDDWSIAGTVTSPFQVHGSMVTTTFSMRLSWSPDGQYIMAGNSYQGSTHVAVAVPRGKWDEKEDYLLICGHRGAVVSPCFAPRLYHVPPLGGGLPSESLTSVFALGAQDGKVSVWAASTERAYFVGKKFFDSQVLDVAWTPDGRTLFACSADKSVACFQFEERELGLIATKEEMDTVMKTLYGSSGGRQTKRVLIESADHLALEKNAGVASTPIASTIEALDARISGAAGITQTGFGPASPKEPAVVHSPPPAKKKRKETTMTTTGNGEHAEDAEGAQNGIPPVSSSVVTMNRLPPIPVLPSITASWQSAGSLMEETASFSRDFAEGIEHMQRDRVNITVTNAHLSVSGYSFAQIKATGRHVSWQDLVSGSVVGVVGSKDFCAVATDDGHVIVYTPNGRRKSSPICLGSGIANLAVSEVTCSLLMVASTSGVLKVYDACDMKEVIAADLAPILEGKRVAIDISLSNSGSPLISLSDSSAYIWHPVLKSWTKLLDDSTCMSNFYPLANVSGQGDVSDLQSKSRKDSSIHSSLLLGRSSASNTARYYVSRSHLEGNLAAAAVLESRTEFQSFLKSYCQLLVGHKDESRLKDVTDELLEGSFMGDEEFERSMVKDVVIPCLATDRHLSKLVQRCQDMIKDLQN